MFVFFFIFHENMLNISKSLLATVFIYIKYHKHLPLLLVFHHGFTYRNGIYARSKSTVHEFYLMAGHFSVCISTAVLWIRSTDRPQRAIQAMHTRIHNLLAQCLSMLAGKGYSNWDYRKYSSHG